MAELTDEGVVAVVGASPARRLLACGVIYALGAVIIYITLAEPPSLFWLIFMLVMGVAFLLLAERLRRATRDKLVWRDTGLYDDEGALIAPITEIQSVDRGAFAFKPSNGFTLKLKSKQPRSWAPGLWWRFGRFLGVGGAVSAGQAKFMAEQIALALAQRSAEDR